MVTGPDRLATEIAHILFLDLVAYSRLSMEEQARLARELRALVRETPEYQRAEAVRELICRDLGDGMALVFFRDPIAPAQCAVEIARALQARPHLRLRMGIHSGPVSRVPDINGEENVSGSGMNMAQRVMDCGDAGHILLSQRSADDLRQFEHWAASIHALGECQVKHGARLHLFNLYLGGIGNSECPARFKTPMPSPVQGTKQGIRYPAQTPVQREGSQAATQSARVFISYRSQDPDLNLAQEFYQALDAAGHHAFMAGGSIRLGENWSRRIDTELERCDYFLLLLSPESATSEMVTEEVQRAKQLRDARPDNKPVLLTIRVNFPLDAPLNYDLRGYLDRIQQQEWRSPADTPAILEEVLSLLAAGYVPEPEEPAEAMPPVLAGAYGPEGPPLPVAEPELPEGQVDLASTFYMERPPIEARCYEAIMKPGALIRIKAPRQMGKTSLMARVLRRATEHGYITVPLSFQLADGKVFAGLDQFLRWFCASVGRRLRLPMKLADCWDDMFGSKDNCTAFFEECLLAKIDRPLVLGLDEVDCVFQHAEIAADFFGLLRAWHEDGKNRDIWKKLRLVVVHSTEVYIPLNINQSPFNVGLPIELPEFSPEQVQELARRHGLSWKAAPAARLMAMVGGHPYLVRVALYHIARRDTTLDHLLQTAPTEAGLYGDHLRRHLWNLEQRPQLAAAVKTVVGAAGPVRLESVQAFQLHSMGLVHLQGNDVTPRCDLYRQYFRDRLRVR